MKKAFASLLTLALLTAALAGCAGGSGDSGAANSSAAQPDASTSSEPPAAEGEEVELNFLIMPDIERVSDVFSLYEEKNPGVKINLEVMPFDQMFEAIEVRLGAKEASVDMLLVDAPVIANYTAKDYIADITPYVGDDAKKRITEASLDYCTINGQVMALPLNSSSVMLYYNKDIFDDKGIDYPPEGVDDRWTWEKVVETARQLTYEKDGKQIYGLSFDQIGRPYQLLPLAQSQGVHQFVSEDGLTTTGYTNSEGMVKAAQWYGDTFNTWGISPKISADDALGYFTGGQVAMFVTGPWQVGQYQAAGMNWGFAPHPYFEGGEVVTPTGSWCVGVSNYSDNVEAAAKFVEFLCTDDEACKLHFAIGGNLPCNVAALESIATDPKFESFPDNTMRLAAEEAINTAEGRPQLAGYTEWQDVMEKTYSDIMNGAQAQSALDSAVTEIDGLLQKYAR